MWPETNCYVDVWAELLPALGHSAEAALAFTVRQDFEGDHFTFFKFPLEDLEALFGLAVQELAIYDSVESHTLAQLGRGRPVLIEVDSHWLPDAGPSYRKEHVKTTVAAIALDRAGKRFGYFHNTGYHELTGDDYEGVFRHHVTDPDVLPPYVELIRLDGLVRPDPDVQLAQTIDLVRSHLDRRPAVDPVKAMTAQMAQDFEWLKGSDLELFHGYAFSTLRQCGASAELASTLWPRATPPARPAPEKPRRSFGVGSVITRALAAAGWKK